MAARLKKYRVQTSDHHGITQRGWGFGKCTSWGPWTTVDEKDTEEQGREAFQLCKNRSGLRRVRLIHGTKVLDKSE